MAYPYRSILTPIEFDDFSLTALNLAKQVAIDKGATIHLLHIAQRLPDSVSQMSARTRIRPRRRKPARRSLRSRSNI
jgi:nucleotide-binding universal stress UspA family protein